MEQPANFFKENLKYFIEGIVIFASVLFSFYIGNLNDKQSNIKTKNMFVSDLIESLNDDVEQIDNLLDVLNESEQLINLLQNDIESGHQLMSDQTVIDNLIKVEVGFSFFPKDGVYNQMISTGAFELINSSELKNILLEMYGHQNARNFATSNEIDLFNLDFRKIPYEMFRIRFDYDMLNGEFYGSRRLTNFTFDRNFYMSDKFYGLLSQAKLYSNMYKRLLRDIQESYKMAISLAKQELVM